MYRIRLECLDTDTSDRPVAVDVLFRQEPEEEENEEEGDGNEDNDDNDEDDDGYSE